MSGAVPEGRRSRGLLDVIREAPLWTRVLVPFVILAGVIGAVAGEGFQRYAGESGDSSPAVLSGAAADGGPVGVAGSRQYRGDATCPNRNPIVEENRCHRGTMSWRIGNYSAGLGGYATQTSVDLGEDVVLKIGRDAPVSSQATVDVAVFRMGYYGGLGGRLIDRASGVPIDNDYRCRPMNATTGEVDCGNWHPTYTIPGGVFPASGVYIAKLTASTGEQTAVVFTVRDDRRAADLLYVLPVNTYEAYNLFGGKSLYFGARGASTISGASRAVKVSFNRPLSLAGGAQNWFFGPDFNLLFWLEKQGFEISYTDDVEVSSDPRKLHKHQIDVISGHSEYWSAAQFGGVRAARDGGVNIASFSANTAYWKVRYEDGRRTLVCYKTVEGSGSAGSGAVGANDWGPDGARGTADDALGADGIAGTLDDNPQNATTTWRDDGAPPGDPNAPTQGRVGPDQPENQLFGVMYAGDNDRRGFPLTVPAANSEGEFAGDPVWRHTGISTFRSTEIGEKIVGWEWDAIPTQSQYLSRQPPGVVRLSATNVGTADGNSWIQDEGRLRDSAPPPGQPSVVNAVSYRASSGALVFASGTMEWSYGLSAQPDRRIEQATYNVLSDMGAEARTPNGITPEHRQRRLAAAGSMPGLAQTSAGERCPARPGSNPAERPCARSAS